MTDKVPHVSVVMSVFNDERYLKESVESILNQTFRDFEFIIINDGSTDSTSQILREYARKDDRIRLFDQANIGLTKSLNMGVSLARGKWIARQDANDISIAKRFEKQLEFLVNHREVGVLGTAIRVIDNKDRTLWINIPETGDVDIRRKLLRDNSLAHGSVMFSRNIFESVGGYDEGFWCRQDYDLWWRMSRHTRLANLPEPLYCWRKHDRSISWSRGYEPPRMADQISVRNCLETIREKLLEFKKDVEGHDFADVSAIISIRDGYSDVIRCTCHILMQDVLPSEIVIVDASKDSAIEKMITETFDVTLPVVRYIPSKPGLAHQRNAGIRNSTGSIILFLNDDMLLYPKFIQNILRFFDEHPGPVGGVEGDIINVQRDEKSYQALLSRIFFSYGFGDGSFKRSGAPTYPYGLSEMKEVDFLSGMQTAYQREVCEEFWFDESFFKGNTEGVDIDFSYRVSRKYKNYYTPDAHSFRNSVTRLKLKKHYRDKYNPMKLRNHMYHFRKNVPKSFLNWSAFGLCVFHIRHQHKFESMLDLLGALKRRLKSAVGHEGITDSHTSEGIDLHGQR